MTKDEFTFASNVERLNLKQCILVIFIIAVILWSVPRLWPVTIEKFAPPATYRLPYTLSNDYWMFKRWCDYAVKQYPCVVIGDSVIWGPYVKKEETLPHALNKELGVETFANLGLDGLHPAAMLGALKYYAVSVRNTKVIINLNPLWLTSAKLDLQEEEEANFNHPELVPQFLSKPRTYQPEFSGQVSNVLTRSLSFYSWVEHINKVYLNNTNICQWTVDNPYKTPLGIFKKGIQLEDNEPHNAPNVWTTKGIGVQNYPWVDLNKSYQWTSLTKVISLLKSRNNDVFIMIGPFNEYMMSEECAKRYIALRSQIEVWLTKNNIHYCTILDLPSNLYADASHPIAEGYLRVAEELLKSSSFKSFNKNNTKN